MHRYRRRQLCTNKKLVSRRLARRSMYWRPSHHSFAWVRGHADYRATPRGAVRQPKSCGPDRCDVSAKSPRRRCTPCRPTRCQWRKHRICSCAGDLGEGFVRGRKRRGDFRVAMCSTDEPCFEGGWREIDSAREHRMEEAVETGNVRSRYVVEIAYLR